MWPHARNTCRPPYCATIGAMMLALLGTTSCGFSPLYDQDVVTSVVSEMASITIDTIPNRRGQILRNKLMTALTPYGPPAAPRYRLKIGLSESITSTGVRADNTRTRGNVTVTAQAVLERVADKQKIYQGRSVFTGAFDRFDNPYATLVAQRDAQQKVLILLTQDIKTRIALALHQEMGF